MSTVNVTRVAAAMNLTEQRVQQLVKEEGMPRESRGLLPLTLLQVGRLW